MLYPTFHDDIRTDISPSGLLRTFASQLPALTVNTLLAAIGRSSNSKHQDLLTELITLWARPVLGTPAALLRSQQVFNYDYGVWGRLWVSKWTIPITAGSSMTNEHGGLFTQTTDVLTMPQAVELAVRELASPDVTSDELATFRRSMPDVVAVETEWTAYRPNASYIAYRPRLTEREMYKAMMEDVDAAGPTILYFHGGAHCLMDPVTHRLPTSMLAHQSGGRVLSVRYRLSPQHVFPSALLDALSAYLSLLAPPKNAYHQPVSPRQIVLAGDSSGGGLAASLFLLLQTLARHKCSVLFQESPITIPDPICAGLALASPWLDVTRSLPSTRANARWDIIAPPPPEKQNPTPAFPPDVIWPASPPRIETYCTTSMCTHPLVSPVAAHPRHWRGAPPVYVCVGWEGMQDEAEVFARRVFTANPKTQTVVFDGYEGMPHCFAMFPWNWAGRTAMASWARFCRDAVKDNAVSWTDVGTWTSSRTTEATKVSLNHLGMTSTGCWYKRQPLDDVSVDEMLAQGRSWRLMLEKHLLATWDNRSKT